MHSGYFNSPSRSAGCLHLQLAVTGGQTYSLSEAGDFEVGEFKMLLISFFSRGAEGVYINFVIKFWMPLTQYAQGHFKNV